MATDLTDRLDSLIIEVRAAFSFRQPGLSVSLSNDLVRAQGIYYLHGAKDNLSEGPLAQYQVRIEIDPLYPTLEPRVFETGGIIPQGQHLNHDGTCCTCVWEEWLALNPDHSFASFCDGPLRDYFLSQRHFELTGEWPFGERSHGIAGVLESYASILGIEYDPKQILSFLLLLQRKAVKGHWPCPCGSGSIIRKCHGRAVLEMQEKVPPEMARRMLIRIRGQLG